MTKSKKYKTTKVIKKPKPETKQKPFKKLLTISLHSGKTENKELPNAKKKNDVEYVIW